MFTLIIPVDGTEMYEIIDEVRAMPEFDDYDIAVDAAKKLTVVWERPIAVVDVEIVKRGVFAVPESQILFITK